MRIPWAESKRYPMGSGIAAVLLMASCSTLAAQGLSDGLKFEIQPASSVFERADEVVVRLTLKNGGDTEAGCSVTYIDPVFYPNATAKRPFNAVEFEIVEEETGVAVDREEWTHSYPSLRANHLIPLERGYFYGKAIRPSRADWNYSLKKGKYRARAVLSVDVKSYLRARPELLAEFARLTGFPADIALDLLA